MATCRNGHETPTTDYCDVCGTPVESEPEPAAPAVQRCAGCGAERAGRFCEGCGHDSLLPQPPPDSEQPADPEPPNARPGNWTAVVRADRAWFEQVLRRTGPDAAGLKFPPYCPERRFVLTGHQLVIGRRSISRGIEPDIDLSGPPLDPGVSAPHALLQARSDGRWELVDLDSTNGTTIGDAVAPIAPNTPVVLVDGEVVRLGAWTTITVRAPG